MVILEFCVIYLQPTQLGVNLRRVCVSGDTERGTHIELTVSPTVLHLQTYRQ